MPPTQPPSNLTLPRILCLHGGGVSASIFTLQSRSLIASLPSYRLVFANAPFFCAMHPSLHPVYSDMGPTFLWSPWLPQQSTTDVEDAIDEIEYALSTAMRNDGGTGEWIGLMGFSQGAMVSFSVLLENQLRKRACIQWQGKEWTAAKGFGGADWRFGIVLAGRAPPYSLSPLTRENPHFWKPGRVNEVMGTSGNMLKLSIPTVHVHGLRDEGLELHRRLERDYCVVGSAEVVEWDGEHRVPIKTGDVQRVVEAVARCAVRAGL